MDKLRIFKYAKADGSFDYEHYRKVQADGNRQKIQYQWVQESTVKVLADQIRSLRPNPSFGLCHGTRRGAEQAWFTKFLGCPVIGTEISDTATQFPNTVQWDFHEQNSEWTGKADFVYSNSWDHSYDPVKMLDAWVDSLKPGGLCILEHSDYHVAVTELDPFGASLEELCFLLIKIGHGEFFIRDIWTNAGVQMSSLGDQRPIQVSHVVIQRAHAATGVSPSGARDSAEESLLVARASLNDIGTTTGTDKGDRYTYNQQTKRGHDFLRHYERWLKPYRDRKVCLLEIGVGHEHNSGGSLRMWDKYFTHPEAQIVGLDIGEYNKNHAGGRVSVEIGDASSADFLGGVALRYAPDIIIDDASHMWGHQIFAIEHLLKIVRPGGVYVIEDIHTSFGDLRRSFGGLDQVDTFTFASAITSQLVYPNAWHPILKEIQPDRLVLLRQIAEMIDTVEFIRDAMLIRKKG